MGVKFCACAGIFAAPREVWASALKASEPANKIAANATKVTTSLRIDFLPNSSCDPSGTISTYPAKHCQQFPLRPASKPLPQCNVAYRGQARLSHLALVLTNVRLKRPKWYSAASNAKCNNHTSRSNKPAMIDFGDPLRSM